MHRRLSLNLIYYLYSTKFVSKMMSEQSIAYGKAGHIASEILSEIKTVKAFGGENKGEIRSINDDIVVPYVLINIMELSYFYYVYIHC